MAYAPEVDPSERCEAVDLRHGVRCLGRARSFRAIRGQGSLHAVDVRLCKGHDEGDVTLATVRAGWLDRDARFYGDHAFVRDGQMMPRAPFDSADELLRQLLDDAELDRVEV